MGARRCRKHKTSLPSRAERGARPSRESERQAAAADPTTRRVSVSGACRLPPCLPRYWLTWRRHFAGLDEKLSSLDLVVVLEQSALWRSRGTRTVLVVSPAMARTHEEVRLCEPANRATKVCTVDGKDLKLLVVKISNPAGNVAGLAVPHIDHGILVSGKPSLTRWELLQPAKRKPRLIADLFSPYHRRQEVAHDRHGQGHADNTVKKHPQFHQCCASGNPIFCSHRNPPFAGFIETVGYGWPG